MLAFEALFGIFMAFTSYTLFAWTPASLAKAREALHIRRWFWLLAGIVAAIGAAALFAGLVIPVVGGLAALWVVAYFVVASLTHITHKDMAHVAPALVFLAIAILLVVLRWGDLAPLLRLIP